MASPSAGDLSPGKSWDDENERWRGFCLRALGFRVRGLDLGFRGVGFNRGDEMKGGRVGA